MSTIPTFVNEQSGETTCADHAGRYLTAALNKRPDLKTTNTPLGRWIRVDGDEYACETCSPISTRTTTTSKETDNMSITIAKPVRKTRKPAAKKTADKKETTVPAKTTTAKKTAPAKKATTAKKETAVPAKTKKTTVAKPVAKKPAPKKPAPKKAAPKKAPALKYFIVYRDITNDVPAQSRRAKSFDPIRYEGVLTGKGIADARKNLAALKGEEYGQYEVMPSYDPKRLSQAALAKFDGATEKVTSLAKDTYKVTLRNIEGLTQDEVQELALYAWIVDAGKKATKPSGNERMMDRRFDFEALKPLKNNRVNVTFTAA